MLKVKDWLRLRNVQQFTILAYDLDPLGERVIFDVKRIFDGLVFSAYSTTLVEVINDSIDSHVYVEHIYDDLIHVNIVCLCLNPERGSQRTQNTRRVEINNIEMEARFLLDFTKMEHDSRYSDNN